MKVRDGLHFGDDSGVALITVIGVVSLLTVLATSAFYLARQAYVSTERHSAESAAFQAANAGIDTVYADLATNVGGEEVLSHYETTRTVTVGDGTADVKLDQLGGIEYLVTATGRAADGTTEQVAVRFYYLSLWEMFIASGDDDEESLSGGAVNGNASVDGPFFVRGDLGATGSTDFTQGPLFVTGFLSAKGNFTLGTPTEPIDLYVGDGYDKSKNFYLRRVSRSVPDIKAPPLDDAFMDAALSQARQESYDNVQGTNDVDFTPTANTEVASASGDPSTYSTALPGWTRPKAPNASTWYKYVGPDGGRSAIGAGETDLTIGGTGSWGSWENDGHGYTTGQWDDFAYNDATNTLYIDGTVFIDGDLTINDDVKYRGNGAIVVNGDVYVNGYLVPLNKEMSENEVLGIISAKNIYIKGDGNWGPWNTAAALYAKESLNFTKANVSVKGSIVSPQINFPNANFHLESDPMLPSFLPQSMPGRDTPVLVIGAWSRQ